MASGKLLYAPFATETGTLYSYCLSCNSPDNMQVETPLVFHDSKEKPLGQVGCNFLVPQTDDPASQYWKQVQLHKALDLSYGDPAGAFIPNHSAVGAKLYLFGTSVDQDNNPMPYLKYVEVYSDRPVLHYFTANDVDLGSLYQTELTSQGSLMWYSGKLYDDGKFTGSFGVIRPKEITPGVYSGKYYEWFCTGNVTDGQLIKTSIIDDLMEYMAVTPEGEWSAPGEGDFNAESDPIDFPELPTVDALSTGLCSVFQMTKTQLQALSNFLWSGLDLDTFKKLFSDPMEAILNLSIMPVDATTEASASGIKIGNINSGVNGKKVTSQYKIIDFGTINLNEYWGSFADYAPYTKLSIYLPYIGPQQLSIDDLMNGSLTLKAYVDVLTGSVQYVLKSKQGNHRGHGHNSVLYAWGGNCQYQIPLSGSNMTQVINSIVGTAGSVAGGIGLAVATGGMTAPLAIGMTGSTIANVMNAKTHVQRGGGLGGSIGIFGVQTPYLILERPEELYPTNYDQTLGQPLDAAGYLKYYTGYVKVRACNLKIAGATNTELEMIDNLLKEGVLV